MRPFCVCLIVMLSLLTGACRDTKVATYRIPKENEVSAVEAAGAAQPASMPGAGEMMATPVPNAEGMSLAWTVPSRWQSKAGSAMRKATFAVGDGAELAVTAFPGDVGGELANLNRWRGQLQLPPVSETELADVVTRIDVGGLAIAVVDILGKQSDTPQRMLGAMVPFAGATWFFKLTGPDAQVAQAKGEFLGFLRTLKPAGSAVPPAAGPNLPPSVNMADTAVKKADGPDLRWSVPAHWQGRPAVAMRKATYVVSGPNGDTADVSVTAFPGDVGGELANLNRWRGQLQLAPLTEADKSAVISRVVSHGLNVALVDFSGGPADKPVRLLGAIVPYGAATWFFKLTGPAALVGAEKPAFQSFIQTLSAP